MNSSDSECFESADDDFEVEVEQITSKQTLKIEKLNIQESATNQTDLEDHDKVDKRKLKTKLGTKISKSSVPILKTSHVKTITVDEVKTSTAPVLEEPNLWEDDDWGPSLISNDVDKTTTVDESIIQQKTFSEEEPNMWDDDDWETTPIKNNVVDQQEKEHEAKTTDSWSSWGTWGVSSILSTATSITSQVSQGLTTVLENGIGAPDPVTLANEHQHDYQSIEVLPEPIFGISNLISGVSQITKLVETTGTKVISGGLDTLETIGKKTMEVLQEGDPGFKKKRAFLKIEGEKPVLSQILREAKKNTEEQNKILEQKHFIKKANYELLFDDHQGLVHLEALEMLSKQCEIKLETLLESKTGNDFKEMQETMEQIKELCELSEDDEEEGFVFEELEGKIQELISEMNVSVSYEKLIRTWVDADNWFREVNLHLCNEMELQEQAIDTLAQLTAISVEQFHKTGELLLIKQHRSTVDEADSLVQLTTLLTNLISYIAKVLSNKLNEKSSSSKNKENINEFITNIYLEADNSSSYIKNAFQLLIPVLQVGAL